MNGLNFSNASDIRLGSSTITALYYGSTLLWPLKRDYSKEYLTIEAVDNSVLVQFITYATSDMSVTKDIQYSKDKLNWSTVSFGLPGHSPQISLAKGEKLYLKGDNLTYSDYSDADNNQHYHCNIKITGDNSNAKLYGNIMSLLYADNFVNQTTLYNRCTFRSLFGSSTALTDASNLILPATTLSEYCYEAMFAYCSSLISVPKLPATTLAPWCYRSMFQDCASLVETMQELPATTLAEECYGYMFNNCTSLRITPDLPATTLTPWCYAHMFSNTGITAGPELPATTLADHCYVFMFNNCASMWTAPDLPATTLAPSCYWGMFKGCSLLTYIKCLGYTSGDNTGDNDKPITNYTAAWVDGVSSTGTFIKNPNMTWPTGISGIPDGWKVEDAN